MPVGISVAEANAILTAATGGTAYTGPSAFWVELHTADPGAAGTTAVAGNGTRKQPVWAAASGGVRSNSADITWSVGEVDATEDYTHLAFWDAATAGTFLGSAVMTANAVVAGDQFLIPAGDLDISMTIAS